MNTSSTLVLLIGRSGIPGLRKGLLLENKNGVSRRPITPKVRPVKTREIISMCRD